MRIEPFVMERWQSTFENQVRFNLSESGVHPLRVEDLVGEAGIQLLLRQELGYPQTNGTIDLRERIAALYPGTSAGHVEVTNGGAEANFITMMTFVQPDDDVVMMMPNYMQAWGLGRAFAGHLIEWPLAMSAEGAGWTADLERLADMVGPRTRMILLCNPNNPTGMRLTAGQIEEICRIAARYGTWILSDEIYRGAELDGCDTPSVWGRYERAIVTAGLSKAYGLPGLRIGWVVAPPDVVESTWAFHDYTTIAPSALGDLLARRALEPEMRARILERTRSILRANLPVLREWLDARADRFSYVPPEAGAIVYARYRMAVNSTDLVRRLKDEQSTLVVPGDQFGMDGYLRIGYGSEPEYLREGLRRLDKVVGLY